MALYGFKRSRDLAPSLQAPRRKVVCAWTSLRPKRCQPNLRAFVSDLISQLLQSEITVHCLSVCLLSSVCPVLSLSGQRWFWIALNTHQQNTTIAPHLLKLTRQTNCAFPKASTEQTKSLLTSTAVSESVSTIGYRSHEN